MSGRTLNQKTKTLLYLAVDSIRKTINDIRGSARDLLNEDSPSLLGIGLVTEVVLSPLIAVTHFGRGIYKELRTDNYRQTP